MKRYKLDYLFLLFLSIVVARCQPESPFTRIVCPGQEVWIDDQPQIETPVNFFPMTKKLRKGQKITIRAMNETKVVTEFSISIR